MNPDGDERSTGTPKDATAWNYPMSPVRKYKWDFPVDMTPPQEEEAGPINWWLECAKIRQASYITVSIPIRSDIYNLLRDYAYTNGVSIKSAVEHVLGNFLYRQEGLKHCPNEQEYYRSKERRNND